MVQRDLDKMACEHASEEEVLIEQFGEEYVRYQQEVGMFIPKI